MTGAKIQIGPQTFVSMRRGWIPKRWNAPLQGVPKMLLRSGNGL